MRGEGVKIVAEQLEQWAIAQPGKNHQDLFARAAFNRYYYAAFLITRQMLGDFNGSWGKTMHASIPQLLRTSVLNEPKSTLNKMEWKSLITTAQKSAYLTKLSSSTGELANILSEAYSVRVIADYEPEVEIVRQADTNVFLLSNTKLSTARTWPDRANNYCKVIRSVWKDIGLA